MRCRLGRVAATGRGLVGQAGPLDRFAYVVGYTFAFIAGVGAFSALACSRAPVPGPPQESPVPALAPPGEPKGPSTGGPLDVAPSVAANVRGTIVSATAGLEDHLESEEREANPRSETVKIKLVVVPAVDAVVWWGGKKLGGAGRAALEIERPRASGPLDVTVRAEGFLPYHTRLFTDRDDRLSIRLVRPAEAVGMLGYKPPRQPSP